ncbi:MAG: hypothetical protein OEW12_03450 [Deltaproteobacteria bacterium]|nr:hypothetical protein [Deltaproteobacteria bacterium]
MDELKKAKDELYRQMEQTLQDIRKRIPTMAPPNGADGRSDGWNGCDFDFTGENPGEPDQPVPLDLGWFDQPKTR